jgi:UDPglucose 6-dehydrogenase
MVINISFIGLGKLGLDCAESFATKYQVVGYDIYPKLSDTVKFCHTVEEAINYSNWIFIAVPTPHDEKYGGSVPSSHLEPKDFSYDDVKVVLDQINVHAKGPKNVVLISTVLPGTIRKQLRPLLSDEHTLIYNPYLIAMGSVKWDMVNPEMVIIGTENDDSKKAYELINIYKPLMENNPRYEQGTWEEAEAIKIFYNTFISAKIGLVNMIQDFAERIGHMNVDVVTNALAKSDMRIMGPKYMTAGMGDSGACHPRDNIALRWLAKEYCIGYDIFDTIMYARERQAQNLAGYLIHLSHEYDLPIIIHGKAYKPDVPYTIGSYSSLVGHFIEEANWTFSYADPLTGDNIDEAKAVILIAHNREITYGYASLSDNPKEFKIDNFYFKVLPGSHVVDPWRMMESNETYTVHHYGNTR